MTVANPEHLPMVDAQLNGREIWLPEFVGASLIRADLEGARIHLGNFQDAMLREAVLFRSQLWRCDVAGAVFQSAVMGETVLSELDLGAAIGLEDVDHRAPSLISFDTLIASHGKMPISFLRGCGIPEPFITNMDALISELEPSQFYSCFISYSHIDKPFAERLYDTLQGLGVRCFLDDKNLIPGQDILEGVDRGIWSWDRVLLCCSAHSLTSWWVDHEIGTALEKEQRLTKDRGRKTQVVIPLDLDGFLFSDAWTSGYRSQLRRRLAADFKTWKEVPGEFEKQVQNLIRALQTGEGGRDQPPEPRL